VPPNRSVSAFHRMNLRRRIATGTLWAALESGGRDAICLAIFVLLARLLGPEAYGLVAMAMIVIGLGELFVAGGTGEALVQRKELEPGHLDTAFWVLLAVAGALMLAVWISAPWLAKLFGQPRVTGLTRSLSIILLLSALAAVPESILRRDLRFDALAARSLAAAAAGGGVGIGMALMGYGAWSLVGSQVSQRLVAVVVLWTASGWRLGRRGSLRHFHDLRAYGLSMIGTNLVAVVDQQVPRTLIGYFLGPVTLGYFAFSWRVFEFLMRSIAVPLDTVAMPVFARLQDDLERLRKILLIATQLACSIAFPSFIGLAIVAPAVVPQLLGERWGQAIPLLQMFCVMGISYASIYFASPLIRALGRPDWLLIMMLIGTIFNVGALLLVSRFGPFAVAIVFLGRSYLVLPVYMYMVHRLLPFDVGQLVRLHVPILASALVMAGAVASWDQISDSILPPKLALATSLLLGVAVYAGVLWSVARPVAREAVQLLQLVVTSRQRLEEPEAGSVLREPTRRYSQ
jgi:polysaccharide transporter, PST family